MPRFDPRIRIGFAVNVLRDALAMTSTLHVSVQIATITYRREPTIVAKVAARSLVQKARPADADDWGNT
jgi:hypothetical protein